MLAGPTIDIRRAERSDVALLAAWTGDLEMNGDYEGFGQVSASELEKDFEASADERWFIVQTRDATPIGFIASGKCGGGRWIGYQVIPAERGKGYGTEAVRLLVDYLFLHEDIGRIQAETHPANAVSQRLLEKAGFTFEGRLRRSYFSRGVWRDTAMHSILREEWGGPTLLPGPVPA